MTLLLKNLLFTIVVPGTVSVWIPWFLVRGQQASSLLIATPVFATGAAIYAWTVYNFAVIGRGTPAPIDAPRHLVLRGPHRFVRNPMYLGVLAVVAGWAIAFRSLPLLAYAALVASAFHAAVLFVEEPALRRQFGEEYAAYCRRVRRWIPRLRADPE
jgi:protein-S-isoprenylcysteine O-methyltransferase Ste14